MPYFIVASSKLISSGVNELASALSNEYIYGDAIFMSGLELKSTKDTLLHMTELNSTLNSKQFNELIITGLRNGIRKSKNIYGIDPGINMSRPYKEILLDIQKLYNNMLDGYDEEDSDVASKQKKQLLTKEEYEEILERAYDGLCKHGSIIFKDDCVLFTDSEATIKLDPEKAEETLCYLMGYFVDKEEYEKCAYLRDVKLI